MSVIGKGSSSFRKKDVMEQKSIALGFKKIRWAHKATVGDTGINMNALVQPSEMAAYGFTNPTATAIAGANLFTYRSNLKLVSSLRGLLVDQLSYVVNSSTQISFIDFTAEDGEIFTGWIDDSPTTSLSVVDGNQIVASGILLAGQTDFNIGTPIEINKNPASQMGSVMVFADRGLQYRKVGNITSGDGDYIEVPVAGGLGSLIRFNASGSDRFITVVSNGVVAERPDGSMMAAIERVQGQVDAMVPTLAQVAGVPETTFQTGPSNVDLKQFGDEVLNQQATLDNHEARIDTLETATYVDGLISFTQTVAADTYIDVANSTIVLPSGQWELVYNGTAYVDNPSGSTQNVFGNVAITDASNVIVDNALAMLTASGLIAGGAISHHLYLVARVNGGTYKLRARCNLAAASGRTNVGQTNFTGGLSDPDTSAKWYARKVGN